MKIYTKRGDDGTTGLFGGGRRDKDDVQVATYGTADETGAFIGQALSFLALETDEGRFDTASSEITSELEASGPIILRVQENLFRIGSLLAGLDLKKHPKSFGSEDFWNKETSQIETAIDRLEAFLPPLTTFILAGGSTTGAGLHTVRTQMRRLERSWVTLFKVNAQLAEGMPAVAIGAYINRLSDYFFVAARFVNLAAGAAEHPVSLD